MPIHGFVDQAKNQRLVADQGLVVTLGVADDFFLWAVRTQRMRQFAQVPIFVALFLQRFDPEIRRAHRQAIIKAQAATSSRCRQAR